MKMDVISTAFLIVALGHLALGVILWLRVRKFYSLPGHFGFPVIGNLYYFYKTLFLGSIESMRAHMFSITEKYGKNGLCFHWIYGFRTEVIVSSPHIVKELAFHPNLSDKPHFMYGGFSSYVIGPFSSILSDDKWKSKRKVHNNYLKRSRVEGDYHNSFIKCGDKLVELLLGSRLVVDVRDEAICVVQKATLENLFGVETNLVYHPELNKITMKIVEIASFVVGNPQLSKILLSVLRPLDEIFFRKVGDLRKLVLKEIDEMIKLNHQTENKDSYLSMQMASKARKENQSEQKLFNELHEVFITSSHTVTTALANSLIFLALLPDIQERAWKEQHEIFGTDGRDPTVEDLKEMLYLERFIKENLRFSSPPFVGKLATADITIDGITIPKGAAVIYLMDFMRMDPKHWKNPKVFDPDRFLEESDSLKYSYTPFGVGVRSCPGMCFASAQLKIILSKVLRKLKLTPVDKSLRFEDLKLKGSIMMEVEKCPQLQVEERT